MNALIRRSLSFFGLCVFACIALTQRAEASAVYHCTYNVTLTQVKRVICPPKSGFCIAKIGSQVTAQVTGRRAHCQMRKAGQRLDVIVRLSQAERKLVTKGAALQLTQYVMYPRPRRGMKPRVRRSWRIMGTVKNNIQKL